MDEQTTINTTLENLSATNNDSNSLEAGEIIDDTPPIVTAEIVNLRSSEILEYELKNTSGELEESELGECETKLKLSFDKSGSSSKPVLGKEKAKQRLKALGIQKKIQMESKQLRPAKISRKKSREKSRPNSKKDKPPTPHEKAKLTKEEIEKLKEKQDCALPCLYYDATMIHHIRAEYPEKKLSSSSNKTEPCLTASLEAIKNYEDQDEIGEGSENLRKGNKPPSSHTVEFLSTEPRAGGSSETIHNYKQTRRKLNFRGSGDNQQHYAIRGRDKIFRKRFGPDRMFNPHFRNIRKFRDSNRRIIRELPKLPQILIEGGSMCTKTKPAISFSINLNVLKTNPLIECKKSHKKKKQKSSDSKLKPKKSHKTKNRQNDSTKKSVIKGKKKKKSNKKDRKDKKERNKKSKISKNNNPPKICGALSFHLNEFLPEEEVETFPLSKDNIESIEDPDEDDTALEKKLKSLQDELNKKSPSPDTDDYMANWEEEEDFATTPLSKDNTPKEASTPIGTVLKRNTSPDGSNTPTNIPVTISTKKFDDDTDPEIRDGLGTPIFVNPSPPAELLIGDNITERNITPPVVASTEKDIPTNIKTNEIQPKRPSSPLFVMQVIYEQFIQSVNEAGIEISLNQSPVKNTTVPQYTPPRHTIDEEECSFTPNASPTCEKICKENILNDKISSSSPKSGSSTPTDSSSDTASSSSSTTTDRSSESSPIEEKQSLIFSDIDNKIDAQNIGDIDKNLTSSITHLPSILSPEDTQKLRSLHKRSKMLKTLQEQSDTMDDEDKQCLLGLEKLIEAEKNLLMRKYDMPRELTEELKTIDDNSSGSDSRDDQDPVTPPRSDHKHSGDTGDELNTGIDKIFDINRETVKLKFSPKTSKSTQRIVSHPYEEDDQDFTEKLLKTPLTSSKDHIESTEKKKRDRKFSRSVSRSPEGQKSIRRGRSLSISPIRRSKDQWSDKQKRLKKPRHYSPPSNRKRISDSKKSRSNRWPLSPLIRRRSRSPYGKRFSRSPPFRPPSPKSPPQSMSPSKDRNSSLDPSLSGSNTQSYTWSNISNTNYYPHSESYYYIPSPADGNENKGRTCESGDFYHSNYRLYNYDYQTMGLYANNYGNEYVGPEPMNSYSRIPVINSTCGNYYYDNFGTDESLNQANIQSGLSEDVNNKEIEHNDEILNTAEQTQFVVQKGNVLEIVPTSIIPKVEVQDPAIEEEWAVKIENIPNDDVPSNNNNTDTKIEAISVKIEKTIPEKRKKKRKSQDFVLWEDEIAKRHIMSAVLRLNKEDDGTLRGILCSKPIDEKPREKKRVIFADGIPPGKSSSTSDDESSPIPLRIPRRIKRKHRRKEEENKENESTLGTDIAFVGDGFKVDPELENLPPPPPPPGDPPSNLPQPVLLNPPSPEQFLYFHFDPHVNSMYISNSPSPMPPRLLNRGIPPILSQQIGQSPSGPRNPNNPNINNNPMGGNIPLQSTQLTKGGIGINPRDPGCDQQVSPPSKLGEILPPAITSPSLQHPERRFRPQQQSFISPIMLGSGCGDFPPPSPIMPGFSIFNRPPLRPSSGNLIRSDFPIPPPSPQQQQQMLGHPSIPFGPRPPGGVVNFNRNIPPPFIASQRGESPSMMSNFQSIQQGLSPGQGNMRSPGSVQLFTPNTGNIPGFAAPTVTIRSPGMGSPIIAFSNSGFTPPNSNINVKNIPILLPKPSGITQPQFPRNNNNSSIINCAGGNENFIPNNPQVTPPPRPGGSFNGSGMGLQIHRPNLGFPRSFGPPPPPPSNQQMFMQQQQQQGPTIQSPIRPMFSSPTESNWFVKTDGTTSEQHSMVQQNPQHPPPHQNISPVVRPSGPSTVSNIVELDFFKL